MSPVRSDRPAPSPLAAHRARARGGRDRRRRARRPWPPSASPPPSPSASASWASRPSARRPTRPRRCTTATSSASRRWPRCRTPSAASGQASRDAILAPTPELTAEALAHARRAARPTYEHAVGAVPARRRRPPEKRALVEESWATVRGLRPGRRGGPRPPSPSRTTTPAGTRQPGGGQAACADAAQASLDQVHELEVAERRGRRAGADGGSSSRSARSP